ncbi:AraC family transcriptional regulator [Leptospira perolatii]|nr:AraC family transcriptional regulator [Leptospira perolatii]
MKNTLFIWRSHVLFVSYEETNAFHQHYSLSIVLSVDQPAKLFLPNEETLDYSGVLIPPNYFHKHEAKGTHLFILQIDPHSPLLKGHFGILEQEVVRFDANLIPNLRGTAEKIINDDASCEEALFLCESMIQAASQSIGDMNSSKQIDPRILSALKYLQSLEDLNEDMSLNYLAGMAQLSEDRFRHLFKENLSISIRRYILNLRVRRTALLFYRGMNMTQAARKAGFADSAHFSRTFREVYGHSPSAVLKNKKRIKVRFCEEL